MNFFKISKLFLYIVPLSVFFVATSVLFPFIVGKYVFFRSAVGLALIFFSLGLLFQKNFQFPILNFKLLKSPLVIAVSLFVLIFVLAGFLGVAPAYSFWSTFERGEGGLQLLNLLVFFLLCVLLFDKSDWRRIFWFSLIAALLMILYGIGAHLKYVDAEITEKGDFTGKGGAFYQTFYKFVGPSFSDPGFRFYGSIGNSAYVATYLVFILFYCLSLFVDYVAELPLVRKGAIKDKLRELAGRPKIVFLAVLAVIFIVFFFLAATRGAFVGLIAAILAALAYLGFSIKKWRKWSFIIGVLIVLIVVGGVALRNSAFIKNISFLRVFDLDFYAKTFQDRIVIWKIAVDGFKEKPVLGWGPENFPAIFDKHYNPAHYSVKEGFGAWYDRAHSVYLDYLTQAGILGLLSFLGIFGVFYWKLFTKNSKFQISNHKQIQNSKFQFFSNALFFSASIAYLVQGLVLFDILPTYINLFLFLSFATYKFSEK